MGFIYINKSLDFEGFFGAGKRPPPKGKLRGTPGGGPDSSEKLLGFLKDWNLG